MARTTVSVAITRESRVSDGKGGKTVTWAAVATATGSVRYYTSESLKRFEGAGAGSASGPGVTTVRRALFVFKPTLPDVRTNDRLTVGTAVYTALFVRTYDRTLQVDAEQVL